MTGLDRLKASRRKRKVQLDVAVACVVVLAAAMLLFIGYEMRAIALLLVWIGFTLFLVLNRVERIQMDLRSSNGAKNDTQEAEGDP